ncbi:MULTISPECIES: hypothetical protein [Pseudoalteromonas]|uniref:hypothetical protein n=1 Tax=Pseudoalteromonas TaxID=53246 RepID=UPI000FFE54F5|nr:MULTISPECIES: hypothetical protein [Pseudoalteromonas]MCG9757817.1 hypothetical protein [Pseudoalteromonas sp. Isolate6]NKC18915.1 hypothetical protein [Pseudoalteromonas galatheae]RXE87459.1 hypothetical protein DRB05_07305 [Pseudoalteromonas sp. A757]
MKITLNKKKIKNLSQQAEFKGQQATPLVAGGQVDTWGNCSFGCDTAIYLGCMTGDNCYSGRNEICMPPH